MKQYVAFTFTQAVQTQLEIFQLNVKAGVPDDTAQHRFMETMQYMKEHFHFQPEQ